MGARPLSGQCNDPTLALAAGWVSLTQIGARSLSATAVSEGGRSATCGVEDPEHLPDLLTTSDYLSGTGTMGCERSTRGQGHFIAPSVVLLSAAGWQPLDACHDLGSRPSGEA